MNWQLGNLAFSWAVSVGGTALALGFIGWLAVVVLKRAGITTRAAHPYLVITWLVAVGWVGWVTFQSNQPRLTVKDYGKLAPSYNEEAQLQNLSPNKKTDAQRLRENQTLFDKNAIGR